MIWYDLVLVSCVMLAVGAFVFYTIYGDQKGE